MDVGSVIDAPAFRLGVAAISAREQSMGSAGSADRLSLLKLDRAETGPAPTAGRAGDPPRWLPGQLQRVDPTWFGDHPERGRRRPPARAFDALPEPIASRARAACGLPRPGAPSPAASLSEAAARWCWHDLLDLPPEDPHPEALLTAARDSDARVVARAVGRLSPQRLTRGLVRAGTGPLGRLLIGVGDRAAAAVCGRLEPALRRPVWQARAAGGAPPSRDRLRRLGELTGATDPAETLFALGAQDLGALLREHSGRWLRQTAQLLPVPAAKHLLGAPTRTLSDARRAELICGLTAPGSND